MSTNLPDASLFAGPAIQPRPRGFRSIFHGPKGLRAGWRLLVFAIILAITGAAFNGIARLVWQRVGSPGQPFGPGPLLLGETLSLAAVLFAAWVMSRFERRRFATYGLPWRSAFGARFWAGVVWGLVALTVLMIGIWAMRGFDFGSVELANPRLVHFAVVWWLVFVAVGLFEETFFRGYALYTLTTGMGFWPAALLTSAAFGLVHMGNPGEGWVGGISAGLIGLWFCQTLRRTGTLWFAIGFHAAWDYAETFIYSVPNSGIQMPGHLLSSHFHGAPWLTGGSIGPEGSVLVFVVMAGLFLIFNRVYRDASWPPPEAPEAGEPEALQPSPT